jgi:hypothetical protein
MQLVECMQRLLAANAIDPPDWKPTERIVRVFLERTSPKHILHEILGLVLKAETGQFKMDSVFSLHLGAHMAELGFKSEGTAWGFMVVKILRQLAQTPGEHCVAVVSRLAFALEEISELYCYQSQHQLASQTSRQSLDLLQSSFECLPEVDNRICYVSTLVRHTGALLNTTQPFAAIPIAQQAISMSRSILQQMLGLTFEPGSQLLAEAQYKVQTCSHAFFVFAAALSSNGRDLEAYEALKEGLEITLRFSGTGCTPSQPALDDLFSNIRKLAKRGRLSFVMLADCVILFRDLARIYPKSCSSPFLQLLYAYVYLRVHGTSLVGNSLKNLLESNSTLPPLNLATSTLYLDEFNANGGVVKDVIGASYVKYCAPEKTFPLIKHIFITRFDQAVAAAREATTILFADSSSQSRNTLTWAVIYISDILPVVSHSNRSVLVEMMEDIIGHLRTAASCFQTQRRSFIDALAWSCQGFLSIGRLPESLAAADEGSEYLSRCSKAEGDARNLHLLQLLQIFVTLEMGRISEAAKTAQEITYPQPQPTGSDEFFWSRTVIQTRILRRTRRNFEALQILEKVTSESDLERWTREGGYSHFHFHILLADLAILRGQMGQPERGLKDVERAVTGCRKEVEDKHDNVETQQHSLVHSLTCLSYCLVAVGKEHEALAAVKEAASIYLPHAPHMWGGFLWSLRRPELGGNMFHSLSLRLASSGDMDGALVNAEKATEAYRELVSLAPRHFPTLASSLRNMSSILQSIDRRDEAVLVCEEAVGIMRKVADTENYFLPALRGALVQLAGYLFEKGDTDGASVIISELADIAQKIDTLVSDSESCSLVPGLEFTAKDKGEEEEIVGQSEPLVSREWIPGCVIF